MFEHPPARPAVTTETTGPPDLPEERFLSRSEAARYLGVPVSTIYHWARTGRLPFVSTLGGHMRFRKCDLDAANVRRSRQARWTPAHVDDTQPTHP